MCGFACDSAGTPASDARHRRLFAVAHHRRPPPTPATNARHRRPPPTPARSHDSSRNPRAMPEVVPACPSKHPRHTAVVFTAKHRRVVFWRASCCIFCASPRPVTLRGSNPDVYVTESDEVRVFYHPLTSQNRESLLGVGSAPATTVRENQPEVDGRTHTTNTRTSTGHTWATLDERQGHVSALLHFSASVFYAIGHLRRGGKAGVGQTLTAHSHCSAQFTSLITPNIPIEKPDAHTPTLPMVPHRTLRWPNTHRAYAILKKCTVTVPKYLMSH